MQMPYKHSLPINNSRQHFNKFVKIVRLSTISWLLLFLGCQIAYFIFDNSCKVSGHMCEHTCNQQYILVCNLHQGYFQQLQAC